MLELERALDAGAATNEYGQPGIIRCWSRPRPYVWQNSRSGLVGASGRSQLLTSTARTSRPSAALGWGSAASVRGSRPASMRLQLRASYNAPCPRRCSASSVRSTGVLTGPSAHSNASVSSNSSSRRAVRHA